MELKEKNTYKKEFKFELDKFADKLEKQVSTDKGDWTVKGFIDVYKNTYGSWAIQGVAVLTKTMLNVQF